MQSTMQDFPLTVTALFRHGRAVHGRSEVATLEADRIRVATFAQVAERAEKLAAALQRLGVRPGDRVGTFCWNTQEHLEVYLAVPAMGAVLHTLNIRLFPEQLAYVANHGEDKIIIVDDSLVPLLAKVAKELKTVEHFIVVGAGDASPLGKVLRYEELIAAESTGYAWPDLDEKAAASMCYTSGTTGLPKGVVYSHRSIFLHSMALGGAGSFAVSDRDRVLPIVPMFHVNAWGLPHAAWLSGCSMAMPARFLQPEPLCRLIRETRPTIAGAVPTIWNAVLAHADQHPVDLSSLKTVICGGAAVPRSLMEGMQARHGVRIIQAWGMTETSPLGAVAYPPAGTKPDEEMEWRSRTGRIVPGLELRIVDEAGKPLPWDGKSIGEIEVRGPWVTGAYYRDPSPEKFHEGWLRTGDVGWVNDRGFVQITDRTKDVIKSGGEWISSVEVENALMGHPDVFEAAVVAVPDERWSERPLACVVRRPNTAVTAKALQDFLASRVARFCVPERWAFVADIPKTSVGKFDKKVLRAKYAEGALPTETLACLGR